MFSTLRPEGLSFLSPGRQAWVHRAIDFVLACRASIATARISPTRSIPDVTFVVRDLITFEESAIFL